MSLWSQTSARFDSERPVIVVTDAAVRQGSMPRIVVRWVCANIPVENLWVRLTDAPASLAEPGAKGHVLLDVKPQPEEQKMGEAVIQLREEWVLPEAFNVRVYSSKAIRFA